MVDNVLPTTNVLSALDEGLPFASSAAAMTKGSGLGHRREGELGQLGISKSIGRLVLSSTGPQVGVW